MECHSFFPFLVDHVEIDRAGFKIVGAFLVRKVNRRADVGKDFRQSGIRFV